MSWADRLTCTAHDEGHSMARPRRATLSPALPSQHSGLFFAEIPKFAKKPVWDEGCRYFCSIWRERLLCSSGLLGHNCGGIYFCSLLATESRAVEYERRSDTPHCLRAVSLSLSLVGWIQVTNGGPLERECGQMPMKEKDVTSVRKLDALLRLLNTRK